MNYYILTPAGWRYLKNLLSPGKYYKKILSEILIPENDFKLFPEDYLMINDLVKIADEKNIPQLRRYKKFLKNENPVNSINEIKFELTSGCNLKCPHCYLTGSFENDSLDFEVIKEIVSFSTEIGINRFLLTGGEPTIHKDFCELLEYFKEKNNPLEIVLFTNGWWGTGTDIQIGLKVFKNYIEFLKFLEECKVKKIVLSIDGIGQDHDQFRNSRGLYESNINIIKEWISHGKEIEVQSILHKRNAGYIPAFLKLMREYGVRKINLGIPENYHNSEQFKINKEDLAYLKEKFIEVVYEYKTGYHDLPKSCPHVLFPKTLWIKASSLVTTCCWINKEGSAYGNLKKESFISVLNNIHNSKFYQLHKAKTFHKMKNKIPPAYAKTKFRNHCGPCSLTEI